MNLAIQQIDRAIKRLYNLDFVYHAEDFLVDAPRASETAVAASTLEAALLIHRASPTEDDLELGLYFSRAIQESLQSSHWLNASTWTLSQRNAFAAATEEVSHFHYFLFHSLAGRPVSHLELETQGEIDKFLITFFTRLNSTEKEGELFEDLIEECFCQFRFHESLDEEQRQRYCAANDFAKRFILKSRPWLKSKTRHEKFLPKVRQFYRLDLAEKVSWILKD